jgi:hypothetical protein
MSERTTRGRAEDRANVAGGGKNETSYPLYRDDLTAWAFFPSTAWSVSKNKCLIRLRWREQR